MLSGSLGGRWAMFQLLHPLGRFRNNSRSRAAENFGMVDWTARHPDSTAHVRYHLPLLLRRQIRIYFGRPAAVQSENEGDRQLCFTGFLVADIMPQHVKEDHGNHLR